MEHVAGYTISNDVSTRDLMFRPNFSMTDFLMSKGRPGFFPTGPYIVPREFVEDYRQLRLTLRVNGEAMQDELVDDIIYGVEDLVAYASTVTELRPGDILLTGSPGGNAGHHGNRWLRPGDVMEAEITGLGIMRNRCVADPGRRRARTWRRAPAQAGSRSPEAPRGETDDLPRRCHRLDAAPAVARRGAPVHARRTLDPGEYKAIEDRAVDEALRIQEDGGVDVVTDGEMRRDIFFDQFVSGMDGFSPSRPTRCSSTSPATTTTSRWWSRSRSRSPAGSRSTRPPCSTSTSPRRTAPTSR